MSSATSTDAVDNPAKAGSHKEQAWGPPSGGPAAAGLQPWQFFVLAALACATVVTYISRGQGFTTVILLSVLMAATALVGLAVLRTVRPLVTTHEDRTPMVGERTRAALEREKGLALRALKELEFDRKMGKLSEEDFREMSTRLRARATRLMKQLDAGAGYRARIEADLAKRLGEKEGEKTVVQPSARTCAACATANDTDARFCKKCGQKLS
jgi:hypothetical protein